MNTLKSNGGFTLVELIVVIAILAILAAVAVPAYSGYIDKASDTAANVELRAVHVAAIAAAAYEGINVTSIMVGVDGDVTIAPLGTNTMTLFEELYGGDATTLKNAIAKHSEYQTKGAKWTPENSWQAGN